MRTTTCWTALAVAGVLGCGGKSSTGPGGGVNTAKVTDPSGDTFGTDTAQIDYTAMTVTRDTSGITVVFDFTTNVTPPAVSAPNAIKGYIDFDVDQDTTTGFGSAVQFITGATTGMSADYEVDLFAVNPDSSVTLYDSLGNVAATIKPSFSAKRMTLRILRSSLGNDDGFLNADAIVGTAIEPTDIVPNTGHLKLGGTGPVAPFQPTATAGGRGAVPRSGGGRAWGSPFPRR
jgi:hypothetical protein